MGCGCKKKNQATTTNSTMTVKLTEGNSNQPVQEINIMEQQVNDLVKKIEEINTELNKEQ
jgi:TolA-binding protein